MANLIRRSRRLTIKITETEIEKFAIELLLHQGCQYTCAPDIAGKLIKFLPLGETEERIIQ
jgi:hypothetical protein